MFFLAPTAELWSKNKGRGGEAPSPTSFLHGRTTSISLCSAEDAEESPTQPFSRSSRNAGEERCVTTLKTAV